MKYLTAMSKKILTIIGLILFAVAFFIVQYKYPDVFETIMLFAGIQ